MGWFKILIVIGLVATALAGVGWIVMSVGEIVFWERLI